MTQWLTLSRAARLIGVPRGELQRQIREGLLQAGETTTAPNQAEYGPLHLRRLALMPTR